MKKRTAVIIVAVLAVVGLANMKPEGGTTSQSARPDATATVGPTRTPTPTRAPAPTRLPRPTASKRDYVLNNETKIFHYPSCYQADRIRDDHNRRQEVTTTREKLIAAGYSPCGNCNP